MRTLITSTFVLVAADCPSPVAVVPRGRAGGPTVAAIHFGLLTERPYRLTHEDLMFETHIRRAGLDEPEARANESRIRDVLLAKPYACMRASALPKTFGWGVHYDDKGRLALYPVESDAYRRFDERRVAGVEVVRAMRNRRA